MTTVPVRNGRRAWSVVSLLFLVQTINFFDKSVIGLAAVPIMAELRLTPAQYGLVASSFYAFYALSGVLVGFFITPRLGTKLLLGILVALWSLSQLPILFFASLPALIAARVMLGIGEGPATAAAIVAGHRWFTPERRNMPSAVVMLGASVGSLVSAPVLSYAMAIYGWRAAFAVCGLLGAGWLVLWILFGADGPAAVVERDEPAPSPGKELSQSALWRDPTILASVIVGFCAYWITGFTVAWLPPLLREGLGLGPIATGWALAGIAASASAAMLGISFLSEQMLRRGAGSRRGRALVMVACLALSATTFVIGAIAPLTIIKLVAIAIATALPVPVFTLGPALVADVVPPAQRGRIVTMLYSGITIAGFLAPMACGGLIGASRGGTGYDHVLLLNAAMMVVGAFVGWRLLHPQRSAARLSALAAA